MWDVLSGDYDKGTSPEKCFKNASENIRNGSIVVFHDSYKAEKNMKYALPLFIEHALSEGYAFGKPEA
jgi:peptidoglycan/xylan/chitin deacetylase (PgdA/CDA1 family)